MKNITLILLLIILSNTQKNYCQNKIYILNEIVGDTISQKEKETYYLFEKIKKYDNGYLIKSTNGYTLKYTYGSFRNTKTYDSLKIEEYKNNIIKIHRYIKNQSNNSNQNETNILKVTNNNVERSELNINEKGKKQIAKEAKRVRAITKSLNYIHDMDYQQKEYYKTLGGGGSINLRKSK